MCGIAGILGKKELTQPVIKHMVDVITHRGPDDSGILEEESFAFGMRRLSIIDLAHGHQPISNEDGTITVVFNGEIYNYQELRPLLKERGHIFKTESDTEGLVHLYEEYGEDMVKYLRGMFAFAIYDSNKKELFIARDHFGIKPLYFAIDKIDNHNLENELQIKHHNLNDANPNTNSNILSFGSEIKSILLDPRIKKEINHEAVYQYLSFQYNPLPETFFKGIYKLMPGHHITIDISDANKSPFKIQKWWKYEFSKNNKEGEEYFKKQTEKTVRDSLIHHMISDVPVGSFLSGGIDSGIIATLVQEERNKNNLGPVSTFTIGFKEISEQTQAKEIAERIKSDHNEIEIDFEEYFNELPKITWHFDEPIADPSAISLYFLAREAKKKVKVVLSGEGADEFFGGYNIYREPMALSVVARLPEFVKNIFIKPITFLPINFFGKNYLRRSLIKIEDRYIGNANIFKQIEKDILWRKEKYNPAFSSKQILEKFYKEVQNQSDSRKMQYIDINTWLHGDILAKADKVTMAHSLELRVPFLDIEIAKLSETIPDQFKYKNGQTKYILREAFESILPNTTKERKKLGFPTPFGIWFRKNPEPVMNVIRKNKYINEFMNLDFIEDLAKKHIEGETVGKVDISRKIFALLMLSLWYNKFIDEGKTN